MLLKTYSISNEVHLKLGLLSAYLGISKSQIIRTLVKTVYAETFKESAEVNANG